MIKKQRHPSDSSEQQLAHKEILALLNQTHNLNLISKKILVEDTLFQSDGYSEDPPIICEIYSRIGKMKVAQHNKITKDILKMLLIEKMKGHQFRKITRLGKLQPRVKGMLLCYCMCACDCKFGFWNMCFEVLLLKTILSGVSCGLFAII